MLVVGISIIGISAFLENDGGRMTPYSEDPIHELVGQWEGFSWLTRDGQIILFEDPDDVYILDYIIRGEELMLIHENEFELNFKLRIDSQGRN